MIGDTLDVTIEKPVYGGDCLAHHAGQAIFVPFVLPGERVTITIREEKRTFARGELVTLQQSSPLRVEPRCVHFGQCGGCHWQHMDSGAQLSDKQAILAEALHRAGVQAVVPIQTLSTEPWAYRNRARFAVQSASEGNGFQLGYRERSSRRMIAVTECPIAAPILLPSASLVAQALQSCNCLHAIEEIEAMTTPGEDAVLVTLLVQTQNEATRLDPILPRILQQAGGRICGIAVAVRNADEQMRIVARAGDTTLHYTVGTTAYTVPSGAFFQGNRWLLEPFRDWVTRDAKGETAWDLYAGVGFFAQVLEQHFASVIAVEAAEPSFAVLQNSLRNPRSKAVRATTVEFLEQNRLQREPAPDWIVLDPPRAGLEAKACALLNAIHAPRMTYVSCDPITMARDLKALTAERFQIDSLLLVDLFPQTFHFESVVQLSRRR